MDSGIMTRASSVGAVLGLARLISVVRTELGFSPSAIVELLIRFLDSEARDECDADASGCERVVLHGNTVGQ
jgi:hypothetical protein